MKAITNAILAVYNFFVGDPVILVGIALTFVIVGVVNHASSSDATHQALGVVLVAGVLISLALSLAREITPKKR